MRELTMEEIDCVSGGDQQASKGSQVTQTYYPGGGASGLGCTNGGTLTSTTSSDGTTTYTCVSE